jgi:hypothetical protein
MALDIGSGESKPIIKYDAKAAKWKVGDTVMNTITMIVDMDNVEVGPMRFGQGVAPDFHVVRAADIGRNGVSMPPTPKEVDEKGRSAYRRGFRAIVKLSDKIANGGPSVREWSSNSSATCAGVNLLHDAWLAAKDQHPGKVPVVRMTEAQVVSGAFGDNYRPILTIINWVPRPADLQQDAPVVTVANSDDPLAARNVFDDDEGDADWGMGDPIDVDRDDDVSCS